MSDLVEFLLARIAEDEAVARELLDVVPGEKFRHKGSAAETWHNSDYGEEGVSLSPARVLAECDAKRRIVEDHDVYARDMADAPSDFAAGRLFMARLALAQLATAYADHPDYDEAWRP